MQCKGVIIMYKRKIAGQWYWYKSKRVDGKVKSIYVGKVGAKDIIIDTPKPKRSVKKTDSKEQDKELEQRIKDFEEKKQRRLERAKYLAEKSKKESKEAFERSNRAVSAIPMGQPILVGHHSETTHRRALKRSWDAMDKSVKLSKDAEMYEQRAKSIANNNVISSDDPLVKEKLLKKLETLENKHKKMKDYNKRAKKDGKQQYETWQLSNSRQNINSVKDRLTGIKHKEDISEEEYTINDVTVQINKDDNRVRLFYPDKPSDEERKKLKSNGFRWSPFNKAWQRPITTQSVYIAKQIAESYTN